MNLNQASLHGSAAAEKTKAAQRSAEVRKKLSGGAVNLDGEPDGFVNFIAGQYPEGEPRERPRQNQASTPAPVSGDSPSAAASRDDKAVSFWA